ncbi:MAG: type II toxin-antitoxin system HicB family antitoxin [Candidatus Desantisbacteria bacterium]
MVQIEYDMIVFKEEKTFVAYSPELDVSSCGETIDQAKRNLKTAVRLFLEEAEKMKTLDTILIEAGFEQDMMDNWMPPRIVATELVGAC